MSHYHKGTGPDIIDIDNILLHYHMVDGEKTSFENSGAEHTHTINGEITSKPIPVDKGKSMDIQTKSLGGRVVEVKETERAGVKIGVVEGYIATWDIDRGDYSGVKDQFVKGCFLESIAEHLVKGRQVRLKDHHGRTIGGFPIENVKEDERGLFGVGEINLDVQQGREAYSLALQGVLTDFSIGFSVEDFSIDGLLRTITKANIWEGSIVDEPMNPKANITQVKAVVPFQNFPLAERDAEWNQDEAIARVKEFTNDYKKGFVWYDENDYRLPIADVVNGQLLVIPKAVFAAAAVLKGSDIPPIDKGAAIKHIERYYAKMDLPSPFEDNDKQYFICEDVKNWGPREIEKALRGSGAFSKNAAKSIAARLKTEPAKNDLSGLVDELKALKGDF